MHRQLDDPVKLPIPVKGNVIYIQGEDGWKMYPPDTPTLQKNIQLYVPSFDPSGTHYAIELPEGTGGGGAFSWTDQGDDG